MRPDTQDRIDALTSQHYTPPASDLGYCACGTVWNIEAMAAQGFEPGRCPDCGDAPEWVEKSAHAD